jgi:hypothetical protein
MLSNVRGLGAPRAATRARHLFRYVPGGGMKTLETTLLPCSAGFIMANTCSPVRPQGCALRQPAVVQLR